VNGEASASERVRGASAPRRRPIVATVCVGGVLLAVGLVAVLSRSAARPTGMNRVRATAQLGVLRPGQTVCQREELVPRGTGALAASLLPSPAGGGAVRVAVVTVGESVAGGELPAGWRDATPTLPLRPVLARDTPARVCITAAGAQLVGLAGEAAAQGGGRAAVGARALGGDVRLVYLPPRAASWWSSLSTVVGRMDAGHPLGGTAIALLVALLLACSAALAAWQLARGDP
jgi:hypothetical protein